MLMFLRKTSGPCNWNVQLILVWVAFILISHHSTNCEVNETGEDSWKKTWRLPSDVRPHEYTLRLEPRIKELDFLGKVTVYFTTASPRKSIILHSKNLNVTNITLYTTGPVKQTRLDPTLRSTRQQVDVSEWFIYDEYDFLVVKLIDDLEPGLEYALRIHYWGSFLNGKLNGFYASKYNSLGNKKVMATTKFEPHHARQAFPCFDEPAMKATFDIEIFKSENETIVSNMPVVRQVYDSDKEKYLVQFDRTPVMSTYPLCWILSDFQVVNQVETSSGVMVRGLARRGHEGSLEYSTDITKKSIEFFEEYLQVPYGLPKLDSIGVPDFSSGAMENWGMVTYRETKIMINNKTNGYMDYFSVVNVICHEIAHMWFGNLVTMKWWDDIWLNEGFATFLSMKCSKAVQPEFITDEFGFLQKKLSALSVDSVVNIHPLVNPVTHNDQLIGVFDEIAYRKGHSILEMLEDTMGHEAFQRGLNVYLKRFSEGVAETSDLSTALDEVSELNITRLMNDWARQPGYPLITVEKQDNRLVLTQARYIDTDKQTTRNTALWDVPIRYLTADKPDDVQQLYFSKDNETAVIELKDSSSWFKLNMGQVGFYRVNYYEEKWNDFKQHLINFDKVVSSWSDRAGLLNDACNLASSGHIKYSVALDLFSYLRGGKESHYAPWRVASKCWNDVKRRFPSSCNTSLMLSEHVRSLVSPLLPQTLASINKKKSSPFDFHLPSEVIFSMGCAFKHPDALSKARELFGVWLNDSSALNVDIKSVILRHGASGENEESRWETLWSLYKKLDDPYELRDLRIALVSFKSSSLLKRLVELARDESSVRNQDYYEILTTMAAKRKTNNIVWHIFKSDFGHLKEKFTNGRVSKLFQNVASNFYTKSRLKEVREFIQKHPSVVPHKDDEKRVEENISDNMKWREKHEKDIDNWLRSIYEKPSSE